jgi:hypothetical protein
MRNKRFCCDKTNKQNSMVTSPKVTSLNCRLNPISRFRYWIETVIYGISDNRAICEADMSYPVMDIDVCPE